MKMDSVCKVCVPQPNIDICSKEDLVVTDNDSDFDKLSKKDKDLFYKISSIGRFGNSKETINKKILLEVLDKRFDQLYMLPCKSTSLPADEDTESNKVDVDSDEQDSSEEATERVDEMPMLPLRNGMGHTLAAAFPIETNQMKTTRKY